MARATVRPGGSRSPMTASMMLPSAGSPMKPMAMEASVIPS